MPVAGNAASGSVHTVDTGVKIAFIGALYVSVPALFEPSPSLTKIPGEWPHSRIFVKDGLGLRPIYHHKEHRADGHLFISVIA